MFENRVADGPPSIEQARQLVSEYTGAAALDDAAMTTLEETANAMASMGEDPRAAEVEVAARTIVAEERNRRDTWVKERYEQLASKMRANQPLTAEEIEELNRVASVLSQDH